VANTATGQVGMTDLADIFAVVARVGRAERGVERLLPPLPPSALDTSSTAPSSFYDYAEEEKRLVDALMAADQLHDQGYESASEFAMVIEKVATAKLHVYESLRWRVDTARSDFAYIAS